MLPENTGPHDSAMLRGPIPILGRPDDPLRLWAWRRLRLDGRSSFEWSKDAGLGRAAGHRWLQAETEPTIARAMLLMNALGVDLAAGLPDLLGDLGEARGGGD